jgi:hypothetical protein
MTFVDRMKKIVTTIQDPTSKSLLQEAVQHIERLEQTRKKHRRRPADVCASEGCLSKPYEDGECWTCPACTRTLKEQIATLETDLVNQTLLAAQAKPRRERGSKNPDPRGARVYFRGELLLPATQYRWSDSPAAYPILDAKVLVQASRPWTGSPMLKVVARDGRVAEFDWDGEGWVDASDLG